MRKLIFILCLLIPLPTLGQGFSLKRPTEAYEQFPLGGANALTPILVKTAHDTPRLAGGGILIEGESTNNCLFSQMFDDAFWVKARSSATVDAAIALDGTTTVDALHEDATPADTHFFQQAISTVNNDTYTFSVYASPANRTWLLMYIATDTDGSYFDLSNCSLGTAVGGATARVEKLQDGVCRCSITWTSAITGVQNAELYIAEADIDITFGGLNQDSIYVWGAQFEESLFPTSYIPTTDVAVTRSADDLTIEVSPVNGSYLLLAKEYGPTLHASKLTVYFEAKCIWRDNIEIDANYMLLSISGNTGAGAEQADHAHNRMYFLVQNDGTLQALMETSDGVAHMATTGVDPVHWDQWFSARLFVDFADFTRMNFWMQQCSGDCYVSKEVPTVAFFTNNTGTGSFFTDGTLIRFGQWYNTDINGNCRFRNLRITNSEQAP